MPCVSDMPCYVWLLAIPLLLASPRLGPLMIFNNSSHITRPERPYFHHYCNWHGGCKENTLGLVSKSHKMFYCKIWQSLEATRFVFRIVWSLWSLTGTSAAVLPICLSNFKAIWLFKLPISQLQDFTRSYDKTSYWILKWGPGGKQSRSGMYDVGILFFKWLFYFP